MKWLTFSLFLLCSSLDVSQGRDHLKNKEQIDDFITHESAVGPDKSKPENRLSSNTQSLNIHSSDFPPLRTPNGNNQGSKREYVNPSWPHSNPNSNSKLSTSSLVTSSTEKNNHNLGNINFNQQNTNGMQNNNQLSRKRDYVNPSWSNSKISTSSTTEKNNYQPSTSHHNSNQQNKNEIDLKNPNHDLVSPNWPTLPPSRSSTLTPKPSVTLPQASGGSGSQKEDNTKRDYVAPKWPTPTSTNNQFTTTTTTKKPNEATNKPLDYSSVVANKNKDEKTYPLPSSTQRPPLPSSMLGSISTQKNQPGVSDTELQVLSEELLRKDTNNAAKYITVNIQAKTTSYATDDKAPQPLLNVPTSVWNMPTIQKMVLLFDNYEWDTLVNEHVSALERTEENDFMDAVMATSVMRHLMNFLKIKGHVTPDPRQQRDFVKTLWFTLYSRGKGKVGSSGFEHVFVSELKNGKVSGMHNWIYFAKEERNNRVNYLGHMKYVEFPDKGAVMKFHFMQQNVDKPVDSMFIGLSPEMQMSLYTLCFVTRADRDCKLKLGGKDVNIITHSFRYRSKNLIGSAYPEI